MKQYDYLRQTYLRQGLISSVLMIAIAVIPVTAQMGAGMMMHGMNSEYDFLVEMIPHHQEAVDTAGRITEDTERGELREFTAKMARIQSNEIEMMEIWLDEWYGVSPGGHMMGRRMRQAPRMR